MKLSSLLLAPVIAAGHCVDPQVTISNVEFVGSGCPCGTAVFNLNPDGTAVTVLFDSFVEESTPTNQTNAKECLVTVQVNVLGVQSKTCFDATIDVRGFSQSGNPNATGSAMLETAMLGGQAEFTDMADDDMLQGDDDFLDDMVQGDDAIQNLESTVLGSEDFLIRHNITGVSSPGFTFQNTLTLFPDNHAFAAVDAIDIWIFPESGKDCGAR